MKISMAWNRGAESNEIPKQAQMHRINLIINHPSYDPSRSKVANDLALIELVEEVSWNDLVKPICIPDSTKETFNDILATVAGWGLTSSGL